MSEFHEIQISRNLLNFLKFREILTNFKSILEYHTLKINCTLNYFILLLHREYRRRAQRAPQSHDYAYSARRTRNTRKCTRRNVLMYGAYFRVHGAPECSFFISSMYRRRLSTRRTRFLILNLCELKDFAKFVQNDCTVILLHISQKNFFELCEPRCFSRLV